MNTLLFQLWVKKIFRSVSFSRNLIWNIVMALVILFFLGNLAVLAFVLPEILTDSLANQSPIEFVNQHLLYFFLIEFIYRFFMQRMPVIELEHFLHLPVPRSKIVGYLIGRSYFSPFSLITFILFFPFSITEIGGVEGVYWLFTLVVISFSLHSVMLWFKQKYGESIWVILGVALFLFAAFAANYFGYYNVGELTEPFFQLASEQVIPLVSVLVLFLLSVQLPYQYYKANAYTEDLGGESRIRFANASLGFLSRFGLAGEMAEMEWKLILRHKKSRSYLIISVLVLLYGLMIYNDSSMQKEDGFSGMLIFIGVFITGSFIIQYGQLFLSWNSSYFDFFLNRRNGIKALIEGKFLLFLVLSVLFFFLTIPYAYFGWEIVLINLGCLIFNIGITSQAIIRMALWKPKPMDLSKGAFFNYEGAGVAQFMMFIPILILPLIVYLPLQLIFNEYVGLGGLTAAGLLGLILKDQLLQHSINSVLKNKYQISASFRQEL